MKPLDYTQNAVLLAVAVCLAILWESGWPFLLLVFWLSPGGPDKTTAKDKKC